MIFVDKGPVPLCWSIKDLSLYAVPLCFAVLAAALSLTLPAVATSLPAQQIDIPGNDWVGNWGADSTPNATFRKVGQTFTVASPYVSLSSFSVWLRAQTAGTFTYKAAVGTWTGKK